ncbi:TetR family transcriptional regulator [Clostridium tyrobutyricum]|jgi:AcrR family transcriptional regulator|uniref:Transcriptional regulator, TetR family n=1 Tax=Clostridium tyrobutyricum DIVETGP TaxID=1408889 RepID=W6N3Z0_CLOTY|nr:TetR/AcrR family transcriptional regulator [Clostridium tyrobutyricum]AND83291.1 transcriptional regulator, TetR family [Clostridium tyrobutyricum]ANP70806.1 TetR family transcriptional regulator [Clostridium tyrobutyricum]MBR9648286.1 TetR/AcrR family transcriptional regulator [Clostridium tyrobutyricum]MBV4417045.1 TetR/AcrR family transcriptional regulator [Clostridium tyrobutyricum]MBV4423187.1 TetR/AcrR family transcriptional regulator [Clostridium tyrobutyricum]
MNNTKMAIFESAIKIFSNYGYDGATMDAIAADTGVAKGTLYYHFKSKEEIFKYIISQGMSIIKEEIEDIANTKQDALSKLKVLCKIQLGLVYEKKDFFKVIMSQLWGQESRQLELRESINKYIMYIQKYLEDAVDEGSIKKDNTYYMAYTLFGSICSAAVYELINQDNENVNKDKKNYNHMIDNIIEYILGGIEIKI